MEDEISISRLNELHPAIRQEAIEAYLEACKNTPKGVHPRITQTMRSFAESDALYEKGRTKPGPKVTNAKAGRSYHNYGLALDFVLLVDGKMCWDVNKDWMTVVKAFKDRGFKWGGEFKSLPDAPHLEKTHGFHWSALLAKHEKGDFIPGNTYVNV